DNCAANATNGWTSPRDPIVDSSTRMRPPIVAVWTSAWRRDPSRTERTPQGGGVHLALRIGKPARVRAELSRRVDERRERRQVVGAGVQAQEVQPDPFEGRDARRQMRRGGTA